MCGERSGAVLAAGAAEGDHQIFETALLVAGDAGLDESERVGEILVHAFLLVQVIDDRGVFARQLLEALFPAGVWQAAGVENESPAVAGVVFWRIVVEGKTEDADGQILRLRLSCWRQTLKLFRSQHILESAHQGRALD